MIRYGKDNNIIEAKCNMCGRDLKIKNGIIIEGKMSVEYPWGYFSDMDGEVHKFDLCQNCYEKMASEFVIPVCVEDNTELL